MYSVKAPFDMSYGGGGFTGTDRPVTRYFLRVGSNVYRVS